LELFACKECEILAPQYSTPHSPAGNGDVTGGVVHHNVRLSNVIVSGISKLKSPSLVVHLLGYLTIMDYPGRVENFVHS
jgi:hypothetical protein